MSRGSTTGALRCSICGHVKSQSEFHWQADPRIKAGGRRRSACRECQNFRSSFYFANLKDAYHIRRRALYRVYNGYERDRVRLRRLHEKRNPD